MQNVKCLNVVFFLSQETFDTLNILNKKAFATLEHITIDQFFPLICSLSHRHEIIWRNRPVYEHVWRVFDCAKIISSDWDCNFLEMGKQDEFFIQCQDMYDNWDWELVDPLEVEVQAGNLINGHHRSFVLGCLLLQEKVDFQPLPVLDLERLRFDLDSDTPIEVVYSAQEFLQYLKPTPGGFSIGEIPHKLRLQNMDLYMEMLNKSAQTWKGLSKSENPADRFVRAKMDRVREDTLMFDSLIIEPADRVVAIAAAFLADAGVNNIETGKTSFFSINPNPNQVGVSFTPFSPTIKIPPPYLHESILGGAV